MNRFGVVGAMALGLTMGWACSGVHTKMLTPDPPDASAQGPDGGAGDGPRLFELECGDFMELNGPGSSNGLNAVIANPPISPESPTHVTAWLCGNVDQDGAVVEPAASCRPATRIWLRPDGALEITCGSGLTSDLWDKAMNVRVLIGS